MEHQSVLLSEVLHFLSWTEPGIVYGDLTLGGGGHTEALLKLSPPPGKTVLLDQDQFALEKSKTRLKEFPGLDFYHGNFADFLSQTDLKFDRLLLDLGVSSFQLDDPVRGFSFQKDGPLDMRMDPSRGIPAHEFLANIREEDLVQILKTYGEEGRAKHYARVWVAERKKAKIQTTQEFVEALRFRLDSKDRQGRHPLTRVFQALRIAVNDELGVLDRVLAVIPERLKLGAESA